jgi:hypothetical protein
MSGRKLTTPENRSSYFHPESKMGDVTLAGLLACGSTQNVLPSQEQNKFVRSGLSEQLLIAYSCGGSHG